MKIKDTCMLNLKMTILALGIFLSFTGNTIELILCDGVSGAGGSSHCPDEYSKGIEVCLDFKSRKFTISKGEIRLKQLNKATDPEELEYDYYLALGSGKKKKRIKSEGCYYAKSTNSLTASTAAMTTFIKEEKGKLYSFTNNSNEKVFNSYLDAGQYQVEINEKLYKFEVKVKGMVHKLSWIQGKLHIPVPGNFTSIESIADFNSDGKPDLF